MKFLRYLPLFAIIATSAFGQEASWIWSAKTAADNEVRYFRKDFELKAAPAKAKLSASCDNSAVVYINAEKIGETTDWKKPLVKTVAGRLHAGVNTIAVRGQNESGVAAVVVRLELEMADGTKSTVVTDETWRTTEKETPKWNQAGEEVSSWKAPITIAKLGDTPWGNVFSAENMAAGEATPVSALQTLPGFEVELVLSADKERHGSWVCMAKDEQGRLLLGSQTGKKITRLTLKDGKVAKEEDLHLPFDEPMGMLFAYGSLYINGNGKATDGKTGHGIYRLRDSKGDGQYDEIVQVLAWGGTTGGGEHGSHGMVAGADGKIYVVSGNFTDLPANLASSSPHRNYAEDLVLGRAEDGNGFGANRKLPGGFIVRVNPDGTNPELYAAGERNTYDIAFNADGELLGFDSDMEWDWGMPWYRPIRLFHAVSGGDQGFREGSGKWPTYYADSLPPIKNIGIGSPTGVGMGAGAKFPARYQKAFYALDWTYGRLIAGHLEPTGASYSATWENFVAPKSLQGNGAKSPLNLTDLVVGADGALYFTTGGRGTQAGLYRVTYKGGESTAPANLHDETGARERQQRHALEAFHAKEDPRAVEAAWPFLGSPDRFLRYAARIAIESQPVGQWRDRVLKETNPAAALNGLLALARMGGKEAQPALVAALAKFPLAQLSPEEALAKVRVVEVTVSRSGVPEHAEELVRELDAAYPAKTVEANRELCQTLLALHDPQAVAKTVALLAAASTQEEQITYILFLRQAKEGWTPELRKKYFGWWVHRPASEHPKEVLQWFEEAGRPYADGSSFNNFLANFHTDAVRTLDSGEIDQLQSVLAAYVPPAAKAPRAAKKVRPFVKIWTVADLQGDLDQVTHGRSFANGRDAFAAGQCALCHRFGNEGGAIGPDLTSIGSRFTPRDVLESIVDPSKVVSEQYANEELKLKDGGSAIGRIVGETPESFTLRPSLLAPDMQEVKKATIVSHQPSKVSPMPPALISTLSKEDVLDLLAYLASGGKEDAAAFKK